MLRMVCVSMCECVRACIVLDSACLRMVYVHVCVRGKRVPLVASYGIPCHTSMPGKQMWQSMQVRVFGVPAHLKGIECVYMH